MKEAIKKVIHWSNNTVMVFNREGKQMPNYQGVYLDVRDKILKDAPKDTEFSRGDWGIGEKTIPRELF